MGVSKVIINGTTKVDLTSDTVASDNLLTGYTAHGADGNAVSGSAIAGADCPTFTLNYSSDWETLLSVTCDKTFSEIQRYISNGVTIAMLDSADGTDTWENINSLKVTASGNSVITYTGFDVSGPNFDIDCNSNGTCTYTSPSRFAKTLNVTTNGTYYPDPGVYVSANVNVPTGTARTSSDLTASGATVTVPAGLYASQATKTIASGSAGTPTATKGTVSNHSVSVTPSVTNTTGYITGSTKTGTAVTVSASELVSGTKTITSNGTNIDVANYATADVNVDSKSYIATISWSSSTHSRTKVKYNNSYYTSDGATFIFHAGETAELEAYGQVGGGSIYVDDVEVAYTDVNNPYMYTLPASNIDLVLSTNGGGSIHVNTVDTIDITSNGTHNVEYYTYADVDVAPTHTFTIGTMTGGRIVYKGTNYMTSNTSFSFAAGDTATLYAQQGDHNAIVIDGVQIMAGFGSAYYTITLPDHDVNAECAFDSSTFTATMYVTYPTITITTNGKHVVSDYYYADVNAAPLHTCTITQSNSTNYSNSIEYNGTSYYNVNDTFTFSAGDTAILKSYGYVSTQDIKIDGVVVSQGGLQNNTYTYTLPDHDIEVAISGDRSLPGGGITEVIFPTLDTTTNGKVDVSDYVYANVSVPASAVVSGTKQIASNATQIDVTNYQYVDVAVPQPALVVTRTPDANGGTIVSIDTTQLTSIEPLNVTVNGTYTPPVRTAYGQVSVNIAGGANADEKQIQFIDYDGTVLYEYTEEEFEELSELPANPSHSGLVAQGWNWTLEEIEEQLEEMPGSPVIIGQMYNTSTGKTEVYVDFDEDALNPYLSFAIQGSVLIDWGDGSQIDTVTGSNLSTIILTGHTYASAGSYVITLDVTGTINLTSSIPYAPQFYNSFMKNNNSDDLTYAYSIKEVRIGNNVQIGSSAFACCFALERVSIPYGTNYTGNMYTFYKCTALTGIVIPKGATAIGGSSFSYCCCLNHVSPPMGVERISQSAFSSAGLKNICIPATVTLIESNAFYLCGEYKRLVIPSSLRSMSQSAFACGFNLETVILPDGLNSLGAYGFASCCKLKSISIPSTVTSLGSSLFAFNSNLASITIPNGIGTINTSTFACCTNLKTVNLPVGIVSIGSYAFTSCSTLKSINIPDSTQYIGSYAFQCCYCLREVTIPYSVSYIGSGIFSACSGLKRVVLTSGITNIPPYAFQSCYCLTEVSIPEGISAIGQQAFADCSALTNITIPNTVSSFSNYAFKGCRNLTSINIPNGISIIPSAMFSACGALTSMVIPSTVTAIHSYAFSACSRISEYHILAATPPSLSGSNVFNGMASSCIIYVPSSVLTSYQTATYWSYFSSKMQGE